MYCGELLRPNDDRLALRLFFRASQAKRVVVLVLNFPLAHIGSAGLVWHSEFVVVLKEETSPLPYRFDAPLN